MDIARTYARAANARKARGPKGVCGGDGGWTRVRRSPYTLHVMGLRTTGMVVLGALALCGCGSTTTSSAVDAAAGDAPRADVADVSDVSPVDVPGDLGRDVPSEAGDVCASPRVTPDCGTELIATGICSQVTQRGGACHVCVQRRDPSGVASVWMAVESPASCGCAPVEPPSSDGGLPTRFVCAPATCSLAGEVCVIPPGPGTCPMFDAGGCPEGCPGCPPRSMNGTCAPSTGCAPSDCNCLGMRACFTHMAVCSGTPATGITVNCLAS